MQGVCSMQRKTAREIGIITAAGEENGSEEKLAQIKAFAKAL